MARVTAVFYETEELPVEIQTEQFSFGQVIYFTVGGFSAPDAVTLLLNPAQMAHIAAAVRIYSAPPAGLTPGGDPGEVA
ncbi:MAG TPA: hypothetical protein PKA10_09550 [Selenomonadales bacterium]|nr:hypothetical protein [Selenomonadales bacterium]